MWPEIFVVAFTARKFVFIKHFSLLYARNFMRSKKDRRAQLCAGMPVLQNCLNGVIHILLHTLLRCGNSNFIVEFCIFG